MPHINHLTDNLEFRFEDIIEVFDKILSGELKFTEKFDGMQIYFGIFPNGAINIARSKGDMAAGGRDLYHFKQKYAQKDIRIYENIKKAYSNFSKMLYNLIPKEDFVKFVPEGSHFFINCEILNPDFSNVLQYDNFAIVIHRVGHKCVGNQEYFLRFLHFLKEKLQGNRNVLFNKPMRMKSSAQTSKILNDLKQDFVMLGQEYGVTTQDNLAAFLYKSISSCLKNSTAMDSSVRNLLARKMIGYPIEVNKIVSLVDNYDTNTEIYINDLLSNKEKTKKKAMWPVDNIISVYSNQIFKLLGKSQLISNPETATKSSGLKCPIEGIVFDVNGDIYKLTGDFSMINKEKWKNRKIKESIENEMYDEETKTNAYMVGGFKPPHLGHYNIINDLNNRDDIAKIYVFISNSPRNSEDGKIIVGEEAAVILDSVFRPEFSKLEIINVGNDNPVMKCCEMINKKEPTGGVVEVIQGKEDKLNDVFSKHTRLDIDIITPSVPLTLYSGRSDKLNGQPVCGTIVRNDLSKQDKINFLTGMPKKCHRNIYEYLINRNNILKEGKRKVLSKDELKKIVKEEILKIQEIKKTVGDEKCLFTKDGKKKIGCVSKSDPERWKKFMAAVHANESVDVKRYLKNLKIVVRSGKGKNTTPFEIKPNIKRGKSAPPGFGGEGMGAVEEMSAMGGGAVCGAVNNKEKRKKDIRNFIVKEIEKLLLEKKIPATHSSTGINVLEDLLKKILPKMERSYKSLTTSKEQRTIWKRYVLQGIENTIIPGEKINDMSFQAISDPDAGIEDDPVIQSVTSGERELNTMLENIDMNVKIIHDDSEIIGKDKKEKYIPIDAEEIAKKDDLKDTENLFREEEDENDNTGKRIAINLVNEIEKQILDAYNLLDNEKDKQHFYDFFLANVDLYAEKWEDEVE